MDWAQVEKSLMDAAAKAGAHAQEKARRAGIPFFVEDHQGVEQ
ncbi:hypothetical protein [Ferroacidibacillus organovorans]|nr:hypothetical protein [Ferroacidibacillus organovorans]